MKYTITSTNVAKKYAKAFLHCFSSQITFADITKIAIAQQFLQDHRRTLFFLQLPQFNEAIRLSMVEDLVHYFLLPQQCITIFLLLISHNRSFLIPEVLSYIVLLYKEKNNVIDFSIKSSHFLDEKQKDIIKLFLDKNSGKKSMCTYVKDKNLIAGIRAQSIEYVWEYSIRKQLDSLRNLERIGTN